MNFKFTLLIFLFKITYYNSYIYRDYEGINKIIEDDLFNYSQYTLGIVTNNNVNYLLLKRINSIFLNINFENLVNTIYYLNSKQNEIYSNYYTIKFILINKGKIILYKYSKFNKDNIQNNSSDINKVLLNIIKTILEYQTNKTIRYKNLDVVTSYNPEVIKLSHESSEYYKQPISEIQNNVVERQTNNSYINTYINNNNRHNINNLTLDYNESKSNNFIVDDKLLEIKYNNEKSSIFKIAITFLTSLLLLGIVLYIIKLSLKLADTTRININMINNENKTQLIKYMSNFSESLKNQIKNNF